jgi:putative endonuclease
LGLHNMRGRAGESLAIAYLELMGCRVRERNARIGGVEVDALVEDGPDTVLVEVKLRSRSDYGGAVAALDAGKRGRLLRAATALLARGHERVRIDVVTIDLTEEGAALRHYRSAVVE